MIVCRNGDGTLMPVMERKAMIGTEGNISVTFRGKL